MSEQLIDVLQRSRLLLQRKSGFVYHVPKIHFLLNTLTETIFILVGINPRKSYLNKAVLMEFAHSRVKANDAATAIIASHRRVKSDYIMAVASNS